MRVLQLEDDALVARGHELIFKSVGAVIESAETAGEALEILRSSHYDILLVDLHLPDMPGAEFVRRVRSRGIDTPVAIVSGYSGMAEKVAAFGVGADDFIAKPVAADELLARSRAIVRRNCGFSQNLLREGELVLDQDSRQVSVHNRELKLSRKQYGLLELLMLRRGRVVTNSVVMDHLYGGTDGPLSRTIAVFLCQLRKKFHQAGIPDVIRTVPGIGLTIPRSTDSPEIREVL